tara:strand:- start:12819 stop:13994 length:1176 start_codon:yes stop_codon:yes gene_type:complete
LSKYLIYILYFNIIFSNFYLGDFNLTSDISLRIFSAIICFPILFIYFPSNEIKKITLFYTFLLIYLLFVFISFSYNQFSEFSYIFDLFISNFGFSFYVIYLTHILVPKIISVEKLISILIFTLFFNPVVVFAQAFDIKPIMDFSSYLTQNRFDNEILDFRYNNLIFNGAVGQVYSGYICCFLYPLLFYRFQYSKRKVLYSFLILFLLITVLLTAQRSAILFILIFTLIYLIKSQNSYFVFFIILLIPTGFFLLIDFLDFNQRVFDISTGLRGSIYSTVIDYISVESFFIGKLSEFEMIYGYSPHNVFLNAFVNAGIIGFLSVVICLFIFFRKAFNENLFDFQTYKSFISFGVIGIFISSLLHNAGLTSGDLLFLLGVSILFIDKKNSFEKN